MAAFVFAVRPAFLSRIVYIPAFALGYGIRANSSRASRSPSRIRFRKFLNIPL